MNEFIRDRSDYALSVQPRTDSQFAIPDVEVALNPTDCWICSDPIPGKHYLINRRKACYVCARQVAEGQPPRSDAAFARGFKSALTAAVLGLILCTVAAILTGWSIGCFALATGVLVGISMMQGSNGVGGKRFQIAAVALTFCATYLAVFPLIVYCIVKEHLVVTDWLPLLRRVSLDGIASFLPEFANDKALPDAIGIAILLVGLRIAWTMTRRRALTCYGPYSDSESPQNP